MNVDHVKKRLILVDPPNMHNQTHSLYRPTLVDCKLSSLDEEVSSILSSDLPDDVKAKHCMVALRQFRHLDAPQVVKTDPSQEILDKVKPELQIKAKRILKQIKPHVRWSDEGELVADNELTLAWQNYSLKRRLKPLPMTSSVCLSLRTLYNAATRLNTSLQTKDFVATRGL